jgi:ABC-type polysaccharide/polyol phosphate transport system ATPase subunit
MTVIEFNNVSKRFTIYHDRRNSVQERIAGLFRPRVQGETFWALRDVSFSIGQGQSLGLVGHNGAGKSTALKLMTRILEPTSGTLHMRGRVAALLELGSGFHPDLSGRENVFLNGSLLGFSRRDMQARLDEIVDFAEIGDFIDMEVKHYSSGMYTRLAFAVATAVDPDILITDEVLAVGDEAFQRKCMERIYRFRQMGKTIIFVSHALETVRTLCDQAVWLDHGRARLVGPAGAVIDAYLEDVNRHEAEARRKAAESAPEESAPEEDARRRGTREAEIVRVELIDGAGHEQPVFQTHAPLTIRIHYLAHQPICRPVFGVALHHEGSFWLSGPNTRFDEFEIPLIDGAGYVDYSIPELRLLNGRYMISATIYDEAILRPYDYHDRMYQLVVQADELRERYGVLPLGGRWGWREPGMENGEWRMEIDRDANS